MKWFLQTLVLVWMTSSMAMATPPETGLASYYSDSFHGKKTASGEKYDKNQLTAAHKTLPFGTMIKVTRLDNNKSVVVRINDRGPYIKGRVIEVSKKAADAIDLTKAGVAKVKIEVIKGGSPSVASTTTKKTEKTAKTTKTPATKATVSTKTKSSSKKKDDKLTVVDAAASIETGGLYKLEVLKLQPKGFGVQIAGYSDYESVVQQVSVLRKKWFKGSMVYVDELAGKPYYKVILGPFFTKEEAISYCNNIKKKYKLKDAFVVNIETMGKKK
ncbi:MAG: septal ring lytic transglycosylase RlpA family protein [Aureispira sp.]|nr:septal ring lytic transglycosylase RlpA family protein [Aureispira sp.]